MTNRVIRSGPLRRRIRKASSQSCLNLKQSENITQNVSFKNVLQISDEMGMGRGGGGAKEEEAGLRGGGEVTLTCPEGEYLLAAA